MGRAVRGERGEGGAPVASNTRAASRTCASRWRSRRCELANARPHASHRWSTRRNSPCRDGATLRAAEPGSTAGFRVRARDGRQGNRVGECHTLERLARVTPTRVVSEGAASRRRASRRQLPEPRWIESTTERRTARRVPRRTPSPAWGDARIARRPVRAPTRRRADAGRRTPPPSREGQCRGHPPARCRRGEWREARVENARQRGKCTHPQKASKPIAFVGRSQPSTPSPRAATARRHCETRARSEPPPVLLSIRS